VATLTLMRAVPWIPERAENARAVAAAAAPVTIVWDRDHSSALTFRRLIEAAGDQSAILLEDDIELCPDWRRRVEAVVAARPDQVIQFFSTRGSDVGRGPHDRPGADFVNSQCFYLPGRLAGPLRDQLAAEPVVPNGPGCLNDLALARVLKARRERYHQFLPSLVQHLPWRSAANPSRALHRDSLTYGR
jgi:hypothetical protein